MKFCVGICVSFLISVSTLCFSNQVATEEKIEAAPEDSSQAQTAFSAWLSTLKQEALSKGISSKTVSMALDDAVFIERVIASDRSQPEFKETFEDYISKRVSQWRIEKGRQYLQTHGKEIQKVTEAYGVQARFVVAIIGVETNYGTFNLKHSLFDVLSTLAFDTRRGARFRKEIFAALEILDSGSATLNQLKSSWAGALGTPQFMPSTYLSFAVDHDGDGVKNIWDHGPDLWASVANYLSHYGWNINRTWARKVMVPPEKQKMLEQSTDNIVAIPKACARYKKHLKGWNTLSGWNDKGVKRMNGTQLPEVNLAASMILTNSEASHAYLVYENFCAIMRYNPSFKYALSVGALSDKLL